MLVVNKNSQPPNQVRGEILEMVRRKGAATGRAGWLTPTLGSPWMLGFKQSQLRYQTWIKHFVLGSSAPVIDQSQQQA